MSAAHGGRRGLVAAIRIGSAAVVVATSVAVTALSTHRTDKVTVVVPQGLPGAGAPTVESQSVPQAAQPIPPALAARPQAGPLPGAAVALSPRGAAPAIALPKRTATVVPDTVRPTGSVTTGAAPATSVSLTPGLAAALADTGDTPQPACPLGWPAPQEQGGLASLIGLAPLAGPFSSEAFAFGAVYQPILRLAGPVLAQIQPVLTSFQPTIDPFIRQVQGVEAVVLQAILPFYGPFRSQLIAAEGNAAAVLAPILEGVYHTPAAACLVAWEGQVIAAAKGGPIAVASLEHPGSVVVLRPKP